MFDEVKETCINCATEFCLTRSLYDQRVQDHKVFYCPNGHSQYYPSKTRQEERIEQLERNLKFANEVKDRWHRRYEELTKVASTCPICGWRSHASPERLWKSLIRHFVRIHSRTRFEEVPELVERTA